MTDTFDGITREKFAEFVVTVVESMARIQEVFAKGLIELDDENNQVTMTLESVLLTQEATERLAQQMLEVAGLPPLEITEIEPEGDNVDE